jgi:hypothetical protein
MPEACRKARDDIEDLQFENGATILFPLDKLRSYFKFEKIKEILLCTCAQCQADMRLFRSQTNRETYVNHIMGGRSDASDMTKTYYSVFGLLVYVEQYVTSMYELHVRHTLTSYTNVKSIVHHRLPRSRL